jgi:hypothetical protein
MLTLTLSANLFATMLEPSTSGAVEPDILRYAITQGGLLAVVLVLIWLRQQEQKQAARAAEQKHEDNLTRISILTDIASRSATASESSAAASRENASAIQRLASAVERFTK